MGEICPTSCCYANILNYIALTAKAADRQVYSESHYSTGTKPNNHKKVVII